LRAFSKNALALDDKPLDSSNQFREDLVPDLESYLECDYDVLDEDYRNRFARNERSHYNYCDRINDQYPIPFERSDMWNNWYNNDDYQQLYQNL
jgi:hypothetical protein